MKKKNTVARFARRAVLTLAAATLVACGGSDPVAPTPVPTPAPPPPPPRVVSQGSGGLEQEMIGRTMFASPLSGRLDVTVDWTFAEDDIDVYLVKGECSFDQFFDDQCEMAALSESETAKPEKISVSAATTGTYSLFIGNRGPRDESLSWQVVLTPGAASSAATRHSSARPSRTGGLRPGPITPVQ